MNNFRQMKKQTLLQLIVLLSIMLVSGQSMTLHIHGLEQDHNHQNRQFSLHTLDVSAIDHSHLTKVHLASDTSHELDHGEFIAEIDVSHNAFLKKVSSNLLLLALLFIAISFVIFIFEIKIFYRHPEENITFSPRYLFSPPLRAPPL